MFDHTYIHIHIYTVTIRLSTCPFNCTVQLSAHFFIEVKIQFKKITLFHVEITTNQIGTMFQTLKKQQNEFLKKIK